MIPKISKLGHFAPLHGRFVTLWYWVHTFVSNSSYVGTLSFASPRPPLFNLFHVRISKYENHYSSFKVAKVLFVGLDEAKIH